MVECEAGNRAFNDPIDVDTGISRCLSQDIRVVVGNRPHEVCLLLLIVRILEDMFRKEIFEGMIVQSVAIGIRLIFCDKPTETCHVPTWKRLAVYMILNYILGNVKALDRQLSNVFGHFLMDKIN